ncbi:MAG: argininosuccinate lyase [Saprospiraceae bacterium]|jgi:argininosuccinate lyase
MSLKLWGGRFEQSTHEIVERFSSSVEFDQRLYANDIQGSLAHARMLTKVGVINDDDLAQIEQGLSHILEEIESGEFVWSSALEDVHMNIESRLTELVGDAGKRLHTGRSRNDQVATDIRLYLRQSIEDICKVLLDLQTGLVEVATREYATIMPGYTHLQIAQPITFGHHMLAWNEMLERDHDRLTDCHKRLNVCPLGSAALAGTSFPIDREMTAKELGFASVSRNSLDSVADRDFMIEFNAAAALLMIHLSRMAEEMILWSTDAFNFIDLGDAFCTGSSIMPQKKNPDVAELVRGKTSRVNANLHGLLMLMKGQPLTYNRDNQEDKELLFDSIDTTLICLQVYAAMIPQMTVKKENLYQAALEGYATATDLADYLVRKQVPFRDAHEIVGKTVNYAISEKRRLDQIELSTLQSFSQHIEADVFDILTLEGSVNARDHIGGTAPVRVAKAAQAAKQRVAQVQQQFK